MVGGDVQEHGRAGRELRRVLELERGGLADDRDRGVERRLAVGRRRREQAERAPDVAGHGDRAAARAVDRADQLDGRRLAVGAGDGDELVGEQAPGQLELADHRQPALARGGDQRRAGGHTRALDDAADALEHGRVRGDDLDTRREQLGGREAGAVGAEHRLSPRAQRERSGDPRAGQPHDQVRARGDRRAAHMIECA